MPRAALAAVEIVLEIGVALGDFAHGGDGALGERRPTQVGIDDHAGRVDDAPQRGTLPLDQERAGTVDELLPIDTRFTALDRLACLTDGCASRTGKRVMRRGGA